MNVGLIPVRAQRLLIHRDGHFGLPDVLIVLTEVCEGGGIPRIDLQCFLEGLPAFLVVTKFAMEHASSI
jgi:hypothetical protein